MPARKPHPLWGVAGCLISLAVGARVAYVGLRSLDKALAPATTTATAPKLRIVEVTANADAIVGTIENTSGHDLSDAQVEFGLYDGQDLRIGSASASISDLSPGERWRFSANTYGRQYAWFRLRSLDGSSW